MEPKKGFSKPRKVFPTAVSNLKKAGAKVVCFPGGVSIGGFKKLGSLIPSFDDLKDVEYFKCHKKGHYDN